MADLTAIATEVSTIDEAILKVLPFISTMLGVIPGAQVVVPFMPLVGELLTVLDNAAKEVAGGNSGAAVQDVLGEIMNHLTKGKPNSLALAPAT